MTTFYEIDKNQYPYSTLHTDRCGAARRSTRVTVLTDERIGRFDTIRTDWCTRCFPVNHVQNHAGYTQTVHAPVWHVFMAIQQAYKDEQAKASHQARTARVIVSLELALEGAKADAFPLDDRTLQLITEYRVTMHDGTYTPAEVEVGR